MKKFGILVPVVTPCDSQGQVDTQGLISVCNEMKMCIRDRVATTIHISAFPYSL